MSASFSLRVNHALQFDGSTSVKLPTIQQLKLTSSFTISLWLKLPAAVPPLTNKQPLICEENGFVCIYLLNGYSFKIPNIFIRGCLLKPK